MERRLLGDSGLLISQIGLGTAQFGGAGWLNTWGPQEDRASIATIREAVHCGINWIDTAPIYGQGHAEEVVGRALRELPAGERPMVFTKCGLEWGSTPSANSKRRLTAASVRTEVEASLRRLQAERIDVYQVHYPPEEPGSSLLDAWAEMAALVDEGKVGAVGLCNAGVADLDACESIRHVDSVQGPLSLLHADARVDVLPWVDVHHSGFIGYRALESGLLTEGFTEERARSLPSTDWRSRDPDFKSPRLERSLAVRDALVPLARRLSVSVAALAILWVLACPGVTGAIVGARRPAQIGDWIQAAEVPLDVEAAGRLDDLARR